MLSASGSVIGTQIYSPYGSKRYSTGVLPTSIGFTGQHADSVTGLDYYNARYYDPVVGRFVSVDMVQGNGQGMDPYGYVGGNPESRTDPTGKRFVFAAAGEDYNTSGISGLYSAGGGTIVSSYVPPPYVPPVRTNNNNLGPLWPQNWKSNNKQLIPWPQKSKGSAKPSQPPSDDQKGNAKQLIQNLADYFHTQAGFWQTIVSTLNTIAGLGTGTSAVSSIATKQKMLGISGLLTAGEIAEITHMLGFLAALYADLDHDLSGVISVDKWDEKTISADFDSLYSEVNQNMSSIQWTQILSALAPPLAGLGIGANLEGSAIKDDILPKLDAGENQVNKALGY